MAKSLLVTLFLALATLGLGQVIPPTVLHSAEAIAVESDRIVIGKATDVSPPPENRWGVRLTLSVDKTLKGKPTKQVVADVHSGATPDLARVLREQRNLLMATTRPKGAAEEISRAVVDLSDPKAVLHTADGSPIRGAAAIEKKLRSLLKHPPKRVTDEFLQMDFGDGSYTLLRVPMTMAVVERLRRRLSSPNGEERLEAMNMITRLDEPVLVPELKRLLDDPFRRPKEFPERALGYTVYGYPVREMAHRVLDQWSVEHENVPKPIKPMLEDRVWNGRELTEALVLNRKVSLADLAKLREATKLRSLSLIYVQLTRDHLAEIARLPQLNTLSLNSSQLDSQDLAVLRQLPALEEIQLVGTQLEDEGLMHLAKIPSLRRIDATRTLVTRPGLWRFHEIRPDVRITIFDPSAVPRPFTDNPLHHAAFTNDFSRIKALLETNPELLNSADADHRTALHYAAVADSIEAAQALLDAGADPNRQSRVGVTPLHWALEWAADRTAMLLVQRKADLELARQDGQVVQLPGGARVPLSFTALTASLWDGRPGAAAVMMTHGANVNRRNELQWTPLMIAVRAKLYRNVEQLIDRGADVNAVNLDGDAALHIAAAIGDKQMVRVLLAHGADPFMKNSTGKRAFDLLPADFKG